ncbi:hypothetical protein NMG60_11012028 [Bertholletia excelsa]
MGKLLPSAVRLRDFARLVASDGLQHRPKQIKPVTKTRIEAAKPRGKLEQLKMEEISEAQLQKATERRRVPLAAVVSDCVKRWFEDTLKEAKAGDGAMQVLVGQMYYSGYGAPRDGQKVQLLFLSLSKEKNIFFFGYVKLYWVLIARTLLGGY